MVMMDIYCDGLSYFVGFILTGNQKQALAAGYVCNWQLISAGG